MGLFDFFKNKTQKQAPEINIDFNEVLSVTQAQDLFTKGTLAKLHLMPLDSPMNIVYVTTQALKTKEQFDFEIGKLLDEGLSITYSAKPEYQGNSFIPNKITVSIKGEKELSKIIDVW